MTKASENSLKYPSGAEYSGQWNRDGEKHGTGTLTLQDGSRYKGQFVNGLSSGLGVVVFTDGSE